MNKAQSHPLTGMPAELWISTDGVYMYPSTGSSSHGNERYVRGDIADDLLRALQGVIRVADRKTVEFDAAHAAIAKAHPSRDSDNKEEA